MGRRGEEGLAAARPAAMGGTANTDEDTKVLFVAQQAAGRAICSQFDFVSGCLVHGIMHVNLLAVQVTNGSTVSPTSITKSYFQRRCGSDRGTSLRFQTICRIETITYSTEWRVCVWLLNAD